MKSKKEDTSVKSAGFKRKHIQVSTAELDVRYDVLDIEPPSQKRKIRGKKIPPNVPVTSLDNISFHTEMSVQRWRYVYLRRIARE